MSYWLPSQKRSWSLSSTASCRGRVRFPFAPGHGRTLSQYAFIKSCWLKHYRNESKPYGEQYFQSVLIGQPVRRLQAADELLTTYLGILVIQRAGFLTQQSFTSPSVNNFSTQQRKKSSINHGFGKDLDRYTVISREKDFRELFDKLCVLGSSWHKYLSNGQELHISLCKKN